MPLLETLAIIVGVVSGVSGLVLGILNYLHQRDTTRPRLRVRPRILTLVDRETKTSEKNVGAIEVCNVGNVPVIGSTVGFLGKRKKDKGYLIITPEAINGLDWLQGLQPGQMVLLRMRLGELPKAEQLGRAFASTIVGDSFTCSRRDMRKFQEQLAQVQREGQD